MAATLVLTERRLLCFLLFLANFTTLVLCQSTTDCGGTYRQASGSFIGKGGSCVWTIKSPDPHKAILLTFSDIQFDRSRCKQEHVEVRDGLTASGDLLAGFCGGSHKPILSSGNGLYVSLLDSSPVRYIFYTIYKTRFRASWTSVCHQNLTNPTGVIQSPGFPAPYTNNLNCTYLIEQPRGFVINLNFSFFSLGVPLSGNCSDVMEVYDGPTTRFPRLGSFCGSNSSLMLTSSGHSMLVRFFTDSNTGPNADGFKATYTRTAPACPQTTLSSGEGQIVSPSFPEPYPLKGQCIWTIVVPRGHVVDFTFHTLALGKNTDRLLNCDHPSVVFELSLWEVDQLGAGRLLERICHKTTYAQKFTTESHTVEYDLVVNFTTKRPTLSAHQYGDTVIGFNASYRTRRTQLQILSLADARDKCPVLEFSQHYGDAFLRDDTATREHTSPVKIDGGVPVGARRFSHIHVHENGKVMFSNQNKGFRDDGSGLCSGSRPHLCAFCTSLLKINDKDSSSAVRYKLHKLPESESIIWATNRYISRFKGAQFNATSLLLVTWHRLKMERHRIFHSWWSSVKSFRQVGNATFQVAIAINNNESYALVRYENITVFSGNEPVIDIGFAPSTHDSTQCQELWFSKTRKAFNISRLSGNSGCEGVWLYKLGEAASNLSSDCDIWYSTNLRFRDKRLAEFAKLPKCPCREEKGNMRNGAYGIWISNGFKTSSGGRKLRCFRLSRSAGNKFYPHGKECCYPKENNTPLVRDRPDAGTATAYNPSFPALRRLYLQEDRLGYDVCCSQANSADCAKFYSLRPIGQCDPKPAIKFAWLCCDPYLLTLDEEEYLFNGWGEYTLVTMTIHRFSFTLQARTALAETEAGTLTNATVFSAVGARENDVSVFVQLDPNTKAGLIIFVNDDDYSRRFQDNPDFVLDEDDVLLQRSNDTVQVAFSSGISFGVSLRTRSLELSVRVPEFFRNKTRGLLGNFNGVKGDDFVLPNGTLLAPAPTERQIFEVFGPAWAVTANNSVMRYGPREGVADYRHLDFRPVFLDEQPEDVRNASRELCGRNLACLYDYIATGSKTVAMESKTIKESAEETNEVLKNAVPTLDPPSTLRATSGETVTFNLRGSDLDGDTLTYHNATYNSRVQLNSATGDVSFVADVDNPVDLRFYAEDGQGVQSPTRVVQIAVCSGCSNHGSCSYDNPPRTGDNTATFYFTRAACVCHPGWTGQDCDLDLDGCAPNPCMAGQNCTDLTPQQQGGSDLGYSCGPCPPGYRPLNGSTALCQDADECSDSSVHGCQMTCTNTEGSYRCGCSSGYRLNDDERTCRDVDECEDKTDVCEQRCHNTAGSYRCSCEEGYDLQSDGFTCTQNATVASACRYAGCSQGCRLVSDPATGADIVQCFCFAGYDQDPEDDAACLDHDECRDNVTCTHNCYNYDGGFACTCNSGYHLAEDKVTCLPCPKLTFGPNCQYTCSCSGQGQACDHVTGCVCQPGWNGSDCQQDIDECTYNPGICGAELLCVNTAGSYRCQCRDGYSQTSGGVCTDIDECADDSLLNNCTSLQRCVNFAGGFTCRCLPGYLQADGSCVDIDECAANTSECQQQCFNTEGSYNCDCYYGYRLNADRVTCTKVTNGCAAQQNLSCEQGCSLDDNDAPFCFCDLGFSLNADGRTCDRILTCANFGCSHACAATDRGLVCSCPAGMTLDNDMKTCTGIPGSESCVQFEARTPCAPGQRCVMKDDGPVCSSSATGEENDGEDEGQAEEKDGASDDALLIGLGVGVPIALIVIVSVVVIVIMRVIKPGKKRKKQIEKRKATLTAGNSQNSRFTTDEDKATAAESI